LEEIIDDAFARISTRIKFCRGQIDNMCSRIGPCEEKIRFISERGAKKATTVFSYSKYPSTEKICDYPCMFVGKRTSPDLGRKQYGLDLPMSMLTPAVRATTTALFLNLVERVEQNVST